MSTLGDRIKYARKKLRLNQKAFAKLLFLKSYLTVYRWENNSFHPSIVMLYEIAHIAKISKDWLLTGHGEKTSQDGFRQTACADLHQSEDRGGFRLLLGAAG